MNVNSLLTDLKSASETVKKERDALGLELEKIHLDAQLVEEELRSYRSKAESERQSILKVCKEECDYLTGKLNAAVEEVERWKQEVETLNGQLERSKTQQSAMLDDLQVMEQEVQSLESIRSTLNKELQSRNTKIHVLEQQLETETDDSAEALKQRLSHLIKKNKDTETLLNSIRMEKHEDLEELQTNNDKMRKDIKNLTKENQRLQNANEKLISELNATKTQFEELEMSISTSKAKITQELTSRIMQLETEKRELKQAVEEMRDEAEIARKSIFYGQTSLLDELRMERPSVRWSRASIAIKPDPQIELLKTQLVIPT